MSQSHAAYVSQLRWDGASFGEAVVPGAAEVMLGADEEARVMNPSSRSASGRDEFHARSGVAGPGGIEWTGHPRGIVGSGRPCVLLLPARCTCSPSGG